MKQTIKFLYILTSLFYLSANAHQSYGSVPRLAQMYQSCKEISQCTAIPLACCCNTCCALACADNACKCITCYALLCASQTCALRYISTQPRSQTHKDTYTAYEKSLSLTKK